MDFIIFSSGLFKTGDFFGWVQLPVMESRDLVSVSRLESRSWPRTSQVSSRSRTISVSSPWSRGPWSQVKMNVCSIWPFAQISDDFYNLDIWRCAFYFVTALFKELVLITIIEM